MKKLFTLMVLAGFLGAASVSIAGDVEFVSTGEGDRPAGGTYDAPDVGDPYAGKKVTERDDAGHPLTQKSYDENCQDDRCIRAKKRQLSEGTTWKDDVKSGMTKSKYPKQ